jgi:predicted nucleic acid-binding protein
MMVFVDTSAYFSLLDEDERNNGRARQIWENLVEREYVLLTSNYVVTETTALVQNRLGLAAVSDLYDTFIALTEISWIDQSVHNSAVASLLTANRRQLSLVDCASFELCRGLGIGSVFAFDRHFEEQGFHLLTQ